MTGIQRQSLYLQYFEKKSQKAQKKSHTQCCVTTSSSSDKLPINSVRDKVTFTNET